MHCFTISTCESVPHFTDKLRTKFNQWKKYQGIRTVKTLEFEIIPEAGTKKMLQSLTKKKNNMPEKSYIPARDICL